MAWICSRGMGTCTARRNELDHYRRWGILSVLCKQSHMLAQHTEIQPARTVL